MNLKHYSYPEGQKIDFNTKIINKLKRKGVICCPTAIKGTNNLNSDRFFCSYTTLQFLSWGVIVFRYATLYFSNFDLSLEFIFVGSIFKDSTSNYSFLLDSPSASESKAQILKTSS